MQKMIHGSLQPPFFSFLFSYTPFVLRCFCHFISGLSTSLFCCCFFPPLIPHCLMGFFCHLIHIIVHLFSFLLFFSLFSFLYNVLLSSNAFLCCVESAHTMVALSYSWHSCDKNLIIM